MYRPDWQVPPRKEGMLSTSGLLAAVIIGADVDPPSSISSS